MSQTTMSLQTNPPLRQTLPLYLGFAATGIGVALPGAILPTLLLRWHLLDEQAGRLFLLAFIGSSFGALLVRGSLRVTIALGSLATALASASLVFAGLPAADLLILLYGLGLGLVMTSTSILRQRQTAHNPAATSREMLRLNFVWAAGAFACPSLTYHALATGRLGAVLGSLAVVFLALAVWATFYAPSIPPAQSKSSGNLVRLVPFTLILMIPLVTGVEASAGAWLATYARRGGLHLGAMVEAPTCLWAGLLLSRLLWSFLPSQNQALVLRGSILLMTVATLLLVTSRVAANGGTLLLLAAALLGFGVGPTYPLLLALTARFHRGGAIFFLAGVGAASLPWLTGLVSGRNSSLRSGFLIPLAATVLLLFVALLSPLQTWSQRSSLTSDH